jgi:ribokinase
VTSPTVVCVGDVMVDVVARLPGDLHPGSDRPAPIRALGGGAAANTACWLAVGGVDAVLAGRIGTDPFGVWMAADLAGYGVQAALAHDRERATGTCIVLVSPDGERTMVPDAGANAAMTPADLPTSAFRVGRHLHLSGYTLLGGARAAGLHALELARSAGMTISVDAASVAPLRAASDFLDWIGTGLTLLANRDEAALLAGTDDPEAAVRRLAARLGVAVVKLGAGGALWCDGARIVRRPAVAGVAVIDTTGAGDAFAAGYLAGCLDGVSDGVSAGVADGVSAGVDPARAMDRGHNWAARACGSIGGRPPSGIPSPSSATLQT